MINRLNPYLKLYETTVEFENQHTEWMEGPLGSTDPDFIEQETGNLWRGFYKLEKLLKETPAAQNIAVKVLLAPYITQECQRPTFQLIGMQNLVKFNYFKSVRHTYILSQLCMVLSSFMLAFESLIKQSLI